MEILLHHDFLIQALSSAKDSPVLDLCRSGRCKGWVASTTLPTLLRGLKSQERKKAKDLLSSLSVVSPTAGDLKDALKDENFEEKLASILVQSCGFDAAVTNIPEKFSGDEARPLRRRADDQVNFQ